MFKFTCSIHSLIVLSRLFSQSAAYWPVTWPCAPVLCYLTHVYVSWFWWKSCQLWFWIYSQFLFFPELFSGSRPGFMTVITGLAFNQISHWSCVSNSPHMSPAPDLCAWCWPRMDCVSEFSAKSQILAWRQTWRFSSLEPRSHKKNALQSKVRIELRHAPVLFKPRAHVCNSYITYD